VIGFTPIQLAGDTMARVAIGEQPLCPPAPRSFSTAQKAQTEERLAMRNSWICKTGLAAIGALLLTVLAVPTTQAARLVSGPNFPWGGVGCAMPNGLPPWAPGTQVFLDSGCQYFPSIEWAIGGGIIIASALTNNKYTCLDVAGGSTAPGSTVVVNPCQLGAGSQRWEIKPGTSITQIINLRANSVSTRRFSVPM
jgi:hypothetical protein